MGLNTPPNLQVAKCVAGIHRTKTMNANTEFSGRIIEIDYETSTLVVRYEGHPPEIGPANFIVTGLPVAYQYHYPDGQWRVNKGEPVNELRPDRSRPLYAPLEP